MLYFDIVNKQVPAYVNITDGGHVDNLGLIALLLRRCKTIVCLDAGYDSDLTCDDLMYALNFLKDQKGYLFLVRTRENTVQENHVSLTDIPHLFNGDNSLTFLHIEVTYPPKDNISETGNIYYVKLRVLPNDDKEVAALPVPWPNLFKAPSWNQFPWYSTGNQFLNRKEFQKLRDRGIQCMEPALNHMRDEQQNPDKFTKMVSSISSPHIYRENLRTDLFQDSKDIPVFTGTTSYKGVMVRFGTS